MTDSQIKELKDLLEKSKINAQIKMVQAVLLVNKLESFETIKLVTGLGRSRTLHLRKLYLEKGIKTLDVKPRGLNRLLRKKDLKEIFKTVKTQKPCEVENLSEASKYWNIRILAKYIYEKYGVQYQSKTSYYLIFKRVKFTYHKPGRVYQKHDPVKVKLWRQDIYPKIQEAKKDKNTVILCEDEMKLSTQTTFQKIWLPMGEFPQVTVSNKKEARSIYGFLNLKTGREHAFKTTWQNMFITRDQLIKIRQIYPTRKILILWDGPGTHRGKEVTQFIQNDGHIETIYFPPYSPEENPQEHVWKEGRSKITHNKFIENIDLATDELVTFFNTQKFSYKLPKLKSTVGM